MLTLTCRTTGQPVLVSPSRLSSIAPRGAGSGSLIRTTEGEYVPVAESTTQIAAMLQPAPEPVGAPEPDAVKTAAAMLRALANDASWGGTAPWIAIDVALGNDPRGTLEESAAALRALADRLDQR